MYCADTKTDLKLLHDLENFSKKIDSSKMSQQGKIETNTSDNIDAMS